MAGESTSDSSNDGGFSPASYGLNLTYDPGMLYFSATFTDNAGATLTGNIIASADDRNYVGNDKYFVDDEGAFYTLSGATFTKRQTAGGGDSGNFVLGTSDMLQFNLVTYATATTVMYELTGGDLATVANVWAGLDGNFRHPLEIVEDEMFIGNKNVIYYLNNAGTTGTAFTLPVEVNVTSLRRHPDGRTLLAFCGTTGDLNGAHSRAGSGRVYFCDPNIRDWTREVVIEEQIDGSRMVGGVVYCTMGDTFGYWDGNGFKPLKTFETSTITFSHQISNWNDILLVRDGLNLLAFGDVGAGNVWWKPYKNTTNTNHINCVSYKGGNVLMPAFKGASAGTGLLYEIDQDSIGADGKFYTNRLDFDDEATVQRIKLLHDATTASTRFVVYSRDTNDTESTLFDKTHGVADVIRTNEKVSLTDETHQFVLSPLNDDIGFRIIRIYASGK